MVSKKSDFESSIQERLRDSRLLAMNCEYVNALDHIERILSDHPNNLEALRLKGNVLEQRALEEYESWPRRLALSRDHLDAQACYENILRIDPRNTVALIDMGDHFGNADAYHQAFKCYWSAVALLEEGEERIGAEPEIKELLLTCKMLLPYSETHEMAQRLAERCNALLQVRGLTDGEVSK